MQHLGGADEQGSHHVDPQKEDHDLALLPLLGEEDASQAQHHRPQEEDPEVEPDRGAREAEAGVEFESEGRLETVLEEVGGEGEEDDHEDASHPQHAPVRERTCLDVDLASRVFLEDQDEERGEEDAD